MITVGRGRDAPAIQGAVKGILFSLCDVKAGRRRRGKEGERLVAL